MASYTSPTLTGYNQDPPPDDGSEQASNEITWATIKTKLTDPLKTYAEAIDSAVTTAFSTVDSDIATLQADTHTATFVDRSGGEPAISTVILQFTQASLSEDTWEGVGPTGTTEPHAWAALDSVPADADWIQLYIRVAAGSTTNPTNAGMAVHMRANGSTATLDNTTEVIRTGVTSSDETTGTNSRSGGYAIIQVASQEFDISWDADQPIGSPDSITIDLRLTGYGYN